MRPALFADRSYDVDQLQRLHRILSSGERCRELRTAGLSLSGLCLLLPLYLLSILRLLSILLLLLSGLVLPSICSTRIRALLPLLRSSCVGTALLATLAGLATSSLCTTSVGGTVDGSRTVGGGSTAVSICLVAARERLQSNHVSASSCDLIS